MAGFFSKKEVTSISRPNGKPHTCISCGAFKTSKTPKMPPFGNFKRGIMNIGESPELIDDQRGKPFQGKYGRYIAEAYKGIGVDLFDDCINLNAINCYPCDKNGCPREPSPGELDTCRKSIFGYIRKYQPKIIVLFGFSAVYSVIGPKWRGDMGESINKWRGWTIPDEDTGAWIVPMISPAMIVHERLEVETIWKQDFQRLKGLFKKQIPVYPKPTIEIIKDFSKLNEISRHATISFDYETTGLKPHARGHKIICVSIADTADHAYVAMMPKRRSDCLDFLNLLACPTIRKMAHNMKFEDTWTEVILQTSIKNWYWDSMQAAHILDNRKGITGLKIQTFLNFGVSDYSSEISPYLHAVDDDNANSLNRIEELLKSESNKEALLHYCGLDSIYEHRLAAIQQKIIKPLPF